MFVNTYTRNYYSLICWPPPRFLLLAMGLGMQGYAGSSPVTTDDASCLVPLSLVSTQALLISHSISSAKLSFFQKAAVVVMIVARASSHLSSTSGSYIAKIIVQE